MENENLSGAFDEEEYIKNRFEEDFREFVASHEKEQENLSGANDFVAWMHAMETKFKEDPMFEVALDKEERIVK